MINNICVICNEEFQSKKKPAMTCSSKCEARKHRISTNPKRIIESRLLYPDGSDENLFIECKICGLRAGEISCHVPKEHNISANEYKEIYKLDTLKCKHLCDSIKGRNNPKVKNSEKYEYKIQRKMIKEKSNEPFLLCDVGYNDGKHPSSINGNNVKEYILWRGMIIRCYSEESLEKHPTYKGCEISDNFKNYSYFYEWCQKQIGFGNEGWHLDKDILIKGNKIYSEDTCCFVPSIINSTITSRPTTDKILPTGVYRNNHKDVVRLGHDCEETTLGRFNTLEEACLCYKFHKEKRVRELALRYEAQIDERVYNALMEFVHIEN